MVAMTAPAAPRGRLVLATGIGDAARARPLRRMKLAATGFLLGAAALYTFSCAFHHGHGTALGFLRAAAEAAMVGGLADWFAVTALFRHPLGLPIPHTALVQHKKDDLAAKLGEFVTGNFLSREVLSEQLAHADVVNALGRRLANPASAARIGHEIGVAAGAVLRSLDDDDAVAYVYELLRRDQARRSYAPVLGRLLESAVAGGTTRPLVDVVAGRTRAYLMANYEALVPELRTYLEDLHWLAWLAITDRRTRRILDFAIDELGAIERNPNHPQKVRLEALLLSIAQQLQHDADTAQKINELALSMLDDPRARVAIHDLIADGLDSVRESLASADSDLADRVARILSGLGRRLQEDEAFHSQVEDGIQRLLAAGVDRYGDELTALIRRQVGRWDDDFTSRQIELAVGRDLQFIRINGTVVGALAGLAIHAVTIAF